MKGTEGPRRRAYASTPTGGHGIVDASVLVLREWTAWWLVARARKACSSESVIGRNASGIFDREDARLAGG